MQDALVHGAHCARQARCLAPAVIFRVALLAVDGDLYVRV
jgi:hypothetical protein